MSHRATTGTGTRLATNVILAAVAALVAFMLFDAARAAAALPPTEEQAIQVEQQLLCPICTNERLDVCSTAICQDMKRIIRERLAAGSSPDDIILYFEGRYGEKVRAELEPKGFNLWLYGWIGASLLVVASLGGWFLVRLQRRAQPSVEGVPTPRSGVPSDAASDAASDAWLDAQIADDDDHRR